MRNLVISLLLFSAPLANAEETGTRSPYLTVGQFREHLNFGAEWTMTSDEMLETFPTDTPTVTNAFTQAKIAAMKKSITLKYKKRPETERPAVEDLSAHSRWVRPAFKLNYPDQFVMTVFSDPGVLEINSSPSSQKVIEENLSRIQSDIFDEGKKLDLEPAAFAGSGHMHIDTAKLHPETVRNFLADYYRHTGLAAGALNEDVFNAIGIGEVPASTKKKIRAAFDAFDAGDRTDLSPFITSMLEAYVIPLHQDLPEYRASGRGKRFAKYFAMSFRSFFEIGTIEIRAIRPQASAESYLKLVKLFVARMEIAERNRIEGILTPLGDLKSLRGDAMAVIEDFDKYVSEAGLNIEDYREFVMPWWQNEGAEFDQYLAKKAKAQRAAQKAQSKKPRGSKAANICKDLF